MALEDVGVKLVAQGEAQFTAAMNKAHKAVDGAADSMDDVSNKSQKATKSGIGKFNDVFQQTTGISLTAAGAIGMGVVALKGLADFAGNAIKSASDMNETLSKSGVVFGKYAKDIEEMGNSAAKSMGMSKQEAIAAAATYGNLFTSMDMGQDVSAKMSANLVQLASDLASFNNIPVAEALEKIRAGLVGEAEPLKSLGININEAALKQEALTLGLIKGKEELSASVKAQAAYSLMLKQSTNAQGDFARTSEGAANQQRILEASSKDLTASIGEGLLPAWVSVLKVGNEVLKFIDNLINGDKRLKGQLELSNKEVVTASRNYEEYRINLDKQVKAQGMVINSNGDLLKQNGNIYDSTGKIVGKAWELVEANYAVSESLYEALQKEKDWAGYAEDEGQRANNGLAKSVGSITDAVEDYKDKLENVKLGMEIFGKTKDYKKSAGEIQKTITDLEIKLGSYGQLKILSPQQFSDLNKGWQALQLANKAAKDMVQTSGEDMPKALAKMNAGISKITGGTVTFKTAAAAVKWYQDEVERLSDGTYLTEDQKKELDDLKLKLGEQKTKLDELKTATMEAAKAWAFQMIQQKALADGKLTDAEFAALNNVALGFGLIDQKSYDMAIALNSMNLDPAIMTSDALYDALAKIFGLPSKKEIYIETYRIDYYRQEGYGGKVTGSRAGGGPVSAGSPYLVGEHGPEPFIPSVNGYILSKVDAQRIFASQVAAAMPNMSVSAGPSNYSYAYNNSYNLSVMTNQSPQVVSQSFSIMRMLAG